VLENTFSDLERLQYNRPLEGRALAVVVESHGIGVSGWRVTIKPEGWAEDTTRENHTNCYGLSMAKVRLAMALDQRTGGGR